MTTTRPYLLSEPQPYYMTSLAMQGARFIEGNDGSAAGAEGETPKEPAKGSESEAPKVEAPKPTPPAQKAPDEQKPSEPKQSEDSFKSEESKRAVLADLASERKARIDFERENAQLRKEVWINKALVEHSIPKEYSHLLAGDSEEAIQAAAKSVAQLANRGGVVPLSGRQGNSNPTGGSVSAGREIYAQKYSKKD